MWLQIPKGNYITVAGIQQNLIWIKTMDNPIYYPTKPITKLSHNDRWVTSFRAAFIMNQTTECEQCTISLISKYLYYIRVYKITLIWTPKYTVWLPYNRNMYFYIVPIIKLLKMVTLWNSDSYLHYQDLKQYYVEI